MSALSQNTEASKTPDAPEGLTPLPAAVYEVISEHPEFPWMAALILPRKTLAEWRIKYPELNIPDETK